MAAVLFNRMNFDDSIKQRLEKIERDGFSGIHPILESNKNSINKIELELKSSLLDVVQLSSVLGKHCCIIFFNENAVVDRDFSISSNVTSSLIMEAICDENYVELATTTLNEKTQPDLEKMLMNVAVKMKETRKYFHQISGDLSTAGVGELMESPSQIERWGKAPLMEFFAKLNNSGEDIGKIAREWVRKFQHEKKDKFVIDCEVHLLYNYFSLTINIVVSISLILALIK